MSKKRNNKAVKNTPANKTLQMVFFGILCLVIALPAFFRGMYFEKEQFILYMISFSTFIVLLSYKISKKQHLIFDSYLDFFLAGLVCLYIISTAVAVNLRLAISECLKYFNYFVVYLMVKELVTNRIRFKVLMNAILVGITGVSFVGIGAAAGTFKYNGAYSVAEKWINSTVQYHNAFGAFVMCGIFLIFALYAVEKRMWVKNVYSLSGFIMLLGFVFSYSRGSWVVFPIVFFVLLIVIWKYILIDTVFLTLSMLLSLGVSMRGFSAAVLERSEWHTWKWFLIGLAVCLAINVMLNLVKKYIERIKLNKKIAVVTFGMVIVLVIAVIAVIVIYPDAIYRLLPQNLLERMSDINLSSGTVRERFVFYFDALDIVKDYPVFGAGGGAWQRLYFMYQSYLYWSTQAHSYIMQVWIEVGTIGLLTYLGILIMFVWTAVKNLRAYSYNNDYEDKNSYNYSYNKEAFLNQAGIFAAALALILHSFIDFDLSLSGITIVLWSLFGLTSVLFRDRGKDEANKIRISGGNVNIIKNRNVESKNKIVINHINAKISFSYLMIPVILALFTAVTFNIASVYSARAVSFIKEKKYVEAKEAFSTAISLDPFQATYRMDYGNIKYNILTAEEKRNAGHVLEAKKQIDEAIKKDKYNSILNARVGAFYFQIADIDTGLKYIEESVRLQPLRPENYQQMADAYLKGADAYMNMGKRDEARAILAKVVEIEEKIKGINAIKMRPVELNDETIEMIGKAKEMLNNS